MGFTEDGIDFERANAARIYDYLLGGAHNFAVDRELAERIRAANPDLPRQAQANRAFLGRVVRWCTDRGIDQFLDLGSGVPTVGNVHEIAHRENPDARVAYVDFEPVAVQHAREITAGTENVSVTRADLRQPRQVLDAPTVDGLLDLSRPVALLVCGVLHFVHDDVTALLTRWRELLAPGSLIAATHAAPVHPKAVAVLDGTYSRGLAGVSTRTRRGIHEALSTVGPVIDVVDWPQTGAGGRYPLDHLAAVGTV